MAGVFGGWAGNVADTFVFHICFSDYPGEIPAPAQDKNRHPGLPQ
jgi:hypothetical protein